MIRFIQYQEVKVLNQIQFIGQLRYNKRKKENKSILLLVQVEGKDDKIHKY